jgi:hypothetical protein
VRQWLASASADAVLDELAAPRRGFLAFTDLLAARALAEWPQRAASACVEALQRRLRVIGRHAELDDNLAGLVWVATRVAQARPILEPLANNANEQYRLAELLAKATRATADTVSHDFAAGGALALERGDNDEHRGLTLTVKADQIVWTSTGARQLGMHGIVPYDGRTEEVSCSFGSPAAAVARARHELAAAVLLGFRPTPPPKPEAKRRKR